MKNENPVYAIEHMKYLVKQLIVNYADNVGYWLQCYDDLTVLLTTQRNMGIEDSIELTDKEVNSLVYRWQRLKDEWPINHYDTPDDLIFWPIINAAKRLDDKLWV